MSVFHDRLYTADIPMPSFQYVMQNNKWGVLRFFIIFLSTKWWVVANIMGLNQLFCFSFFTLCLCLKLCKLNVLTVIIIKIEVFLCLSWKRMGSGGIAPQNLTSLLVGGEWSASCSDTFCPGKGLLLMCWIQGWAFIMLTYKPFLNMACHYFTLSFLIQRQCLLDS